MCCVTETEPAAVSYHFPLYTGEIKLGRKGKGKGKVGLNTRPSPIPFAGYDPAKNDWKCKECGGFNYAQNVKC